MSGKKATMEVSKAAKAATPSPAALSATGSSQTSKDNTNKDMTRKKKVIQFNWTEAKQLALVSEGQGEGLHLKKGLKDIDVLWQKSLNRIIETDEFAADKAAGNTTNLTARRTKDKFWAIVKAVTTFVNSGNTSKKMSKTFGRIAKCVKTIVVEMEDKQADSDAKDAEKAVMGSLEHEIIATGLGLAGNANEQLI